MTSLILNNWALVNMLIKNRMLSATVLGTIEGWSELSFSNREARATLARGEIHLITVDHFIVLNLSLSSFHRLDMTEIRLKKM